MRRRLEGPDDLMDALRAGRPVRLVLVGSACGGPAEIAVAAAREAGVPVRVVSPPVLRRFSGGAPAELLALVGPPVEATLGELVARDGVVWLLSGVVYPGNAGFAMRTAEVSGAAGIVLDLPLAGRGRRAAERASMQSQRLLPVLWESTEACVAAARAAGRRVVVLEDAGGDLPSETDWSGRPLVVVGGEADGLTPEMVSAADVRVRVPMAGFIPSYNLHAAMAAVAAACAASAASAASAGSGSGSAT